MAPGHRPLDCFFVAFKHGLDPAVASCVADVVRTLEFPRPTDGAPVDVTYPFDCSPTGG